MAEIERVRGRERESPWLAPLHEIVEQLFTFRPFFVVVSAVVGIFLLGLRFCCKCKIITTKLHFQLLTFRAAAQQAASSAAIQVVRQFA